MTSWRVMLLREMARHGETLDDVEAHTFTDSDLDAGFSVAYGATKGCAFTVWTRKRVYFPAQYDGMEWVESVARHPDGLPTQHVGGG